MEFGPSGGRHGEVNQRVARPGARAGPGRPGARAGRHLPIKRGRSPAARARGPATSWVARAGIESARALIVDIVLTRPRHARRRSPGTRPGLGACRRILGNGRSAAAGGVRTTPGGPGHASAALAFHQRRIHWCSFLISTSKRVESAAPRARKALRRRGWPDPARGPAPGDLACGPEGRPHVAIRLTSQGRGDSPGPGFPSAAIVSIGSEADGRSGRPGRCAAGCCERLRSSSGRGRLVGALVANRIRRAKGLVRITVFSALTDPARD